MKATVPRIPSVVQTASYQEIAQIQMDAVRAHAKQLGRALSILEAGCGQRWTVNLRGTNYTLTGVDLDDVALECVKRKLATWTWRFTVTFAPSTCRKRRLTSFTAVSFGACAQPRCRA